MTLRRPLALVLLSVGLGCGGGPPSNKPINEGPATKPPSEVTKKKFGDRTAGILAGATKAEVFRIDGGGMTSSPRPVGPGDPSVDGFAMTTRGQDQGPEFAARLNDVLSDPKTYTDGFVQCFNPGVAFRVWSGEESVDVVICFLCHNVYIGPQSDERVRENASFNGSPNESRLVRLAKEAFPDDKEIQALKAE